MKSNLGWILLGVVILILVLVIPGILFFGNWGGGFGIGHGEMMRPGGGMMGRSIWAFPLGGIMMLSAVLIPLGLLILLVVGAVWLFNNLNRSGKVPADRVPLAEGVPPVGQAPPAGSCPNCGKPIQADWQVCPYCRTTLSG